MELALGANIASDDVLQAIISRLVLDGPVGSLLYALAKERLCEVTAEAKQRGIFGAASFVIGTASCCGR